MVTDRQYQVLGYHYTSCVHYAETKDWDKIQLHTMAAEMVIMIETEEDFKKYRNFCIRNKITYYKNIWKQQ